MTLDVENVSISYIVGDFKSIGVKEFVTRKLTRRYKVEEYWAVKDVSFSLHEGDILGIIGKNGAGKSTLLKAVSGIMLPSIGTIRCHGRISSLLELGTGFDDDLTVTENVFLRGAMMGYSRNFMVDHYKQIIDFAELTKFNDYAFKCLSSGMKSRLAFSIASFVQPDVLILDEVLAVGDGAFRKKSEKKLHEIMNDGAVTILVSHSLDQIRDLCNQVMWMERGKVRMFDKADIVCDEYERYLNL